MNEEVELIDKFLDIQKRLKTLGLELQVRTLDKFAINHPSLNGLVCFETIKELSWWVYGFECSEQIKEQEK